MSLLHKSAPALIALGVVGAAFGAAAVIIDANTRAQAATATKTTGTDCDKVLGPDSTATPAQYLECLIPYGYNHQIK